MSSDDERQAPAEIDYYIEDDGDGIYTLMVGGVPVVKIDWVNQIRQARWQVYGPADLDRSIAMMKGFLHLTALLGNEKRAFDRPPKSKAPVFEKSEKHKWQTSKMTPKSKSS